MFDTAAQAEQAFYEAFAQQDLKAMMRVWDTEGPVLCIHPGGHLLAGREEVQKSWRQIFQSGTPFHFDLDCHHREVSDQLVLTHLTETLVMHNRIVGVVLATNGYRATPNGWRMILHHGSPQFDAEERGPSAPVLH